MERLETRNFPQFCLIKPACNKFNTTQSWKIRFFFAGVGQVLVSTPAAFNWAFSAPVCNNEIVSDLDGSGPLPASLFRGVRVPKQVWWVLLLWVVDLVHIDHFEFRAVRGVSSHWWWQLWWSNSAEDSKHVLYCFCCPCGEQRPNAQKK